jgi:site-specific DNA-methyltransferase (adenine-specific)
MSNLRIENISIASLAFDSGNARKHDQKNLDAIESSLRLFGQRKPIVVTGANIVVAGNGTLEAAKNMGWEKIDVVRIPSDWTPEQVKAYALADNRTAELAEWDSSILAQQLLELDAVGWDLKELGFETLEPPTDIEILEQDEIPELPINPVSKLGDVWQLGRHRLMCGDSTKEKDVAKLMNDEVADLVVTDPPYNVAIENSAGLTIKNDDMENTKFQEFLTSCFKNLEKSLKPGGSFYVWYASRQHINFEQSLKKAGFSVRQQLIWNKNTFILGRQDYHWKHEPCLYGWKDGAAHYFAEDRTQSTIFQDKKIDVKKMKREELENTLEQLIEEKANTTVIDADKPHVNDLHPTMKPIKLIGKLIANSSKTDQLVLDLFGGAGSTLIAAEQLGRKCFIMEFDPRYSDVIIKRWEKLTGLEAQLLES